MGRTEFSLRGVRRRSTPTGTIPTFDPVAAGAQSEPARDARRGDTGAAAPQGDRRVVWVHRAGAGLVAAVIAVFGALGLVGGLGFFDTRGTPVLGLSTNGLLSLVSLVTAVVLVAAAYRGGKTASTTMMITGVLFLVSAFVNLAALGTAFNLLAFELPNVFFSIGAGLVLLFLGAYGRASARLPADNPYWLEHHDPADGDSVTRSPIDAQPRPDGPVEAAADVAMADAERAVAAGAATTDQRSGVRAMGSWRTQEQRRAAWIDHEAGV